MRRALPIALLLAAASARAEGPGLKVSDSLVLHLGVAVGAGFDSNLFYSTGNADDPEVRAFYLTLRPTVDLATLSLQRGGGAPHTLDFRLHLGADARFLVSTDPNTYRHWGVGIDGGFALTVNPMGAYTIDLFDTYTRTSQPPYRTVNVPGETDNNMTWDQNQLGLRLRIRPGGQRLEIGAQYIFGFYLFEEPRPLLGKDYISNDVQLRVSWKFFPKTALYINAQETIYTYFNGGFANAPGTAYPLRTILGLIGLITTKLELHTYVGYGNSFSQAPGTPSYNNAIGQVELKWKPTLLTTLILGYRHDFPQALVGEYYDLDTVYTSLSQQIWRIVAGLRVGYERRRYHGSFNPTLMRVDLSKDGLSNDEEIDPRIDHLIAFHLQADLPIRDWLYVSIGDDLTKDISSCKLLPNASGAPVTLDPCNYLRNDLWLRLGVAY